MELAILAVGTWVLIREEVFGGLVMLLEDDPDLIDELPGLEELRPFLYEICKHVQNKGVITLYSEAHGPASWDVRRTTRDWAFGTRAIHTKLFPVRVMKILKQDRVMAVVVRSYTNEDDFETGGKVKEIRGYRVWLGDGINFEQIGAEEMAVMSRKDSFTGNDLEPERAVVYCGPNGDRYDGWFRPR
jgi:hypothetical protein